MLTEDVINECARMLGLLSENESGEKILEESDREKLLAAVGYTADEIARDYVPLISEQTFDVKEDKRIKYGDFEREPIAVLRVKRGGANLTFERLYDSLQLGCSGTVKVKYAFKPPQTALGGEMPWKDSVVPLRVLAYGAATEYSLMSGQTSDAQMWDKRYRDALERMLLHLNSGRKTPRRRWLG